MNDSEHDLYKSYENEPAHIHEIEEESEDVSDTQEDDRKDLSDAQEDEREDISDAQEERTEDISALLQTRYIANFDPPQSLAELNLAESDNLSWAEEYLPLFITMPLTDQHDIIPRYNGPQHHLDPSVTAGWTGGPSAGWLMFTQPAYPSHGYVGHSHGYPGQVLRMQMGYQGPQYLPVTIHPLLPPPFILPFQSHYRARPFSFYQAPVRRAQFNNKKVSLDNCQGCDMGDQLEKKRTLL